MREHVLIAGASGVVGTAVVHHYAPRRDVTVTAVSRRPPLPPSPPAPPVRHVSLDLRDAAACAAAAEELAGVTHLVYTALHEKPGLVPGWLERDQIEANDRMFANLLGAVSRSSPGLRHMTLLQGTKAYGAHVRPIPLPAREGRDELREQANFYWEQEERLRAAAREAGWHWTILRPQIVFGLSIGAAMNLIPAIGVYAALLREKGEPLFFPGGSAPVLEAVDADLLAHAIAWAGDAPEARDEIFNVTNGDVFVWRHVWPAIADALGMEPGPDRPESLGRTMPDRAAEWDVIRKKHALEAPAILDFVGESLHYADFCMAYGATDALPAAIVSTVKLRRAGFTEAIDTEEMFRKWFARFRDRRLLP